VNFHQNQNKRLFADIVNGFSEFKDPINKSICYIKHFNELDFANFENKKIEFYDKAVKLKLPTNKEQEDYILSEKFWSKEIDFELENKNLYLQNLKKTKSKLFLVSQIEQLNQEINKLEFEILTKKQERERLIGYTAEKYADNRMNIIYIAYSIFKDRELKLNYFSETELEEFNDKSFYDYIISYNNIMNDFKEDSVKKIALEHHVQNMIAFCGDNLYNFYCKPIAYLTNFQSLLLLYGRFFRNIMMSEDYAKVPDDIKKDADKLTNWFTASKNLKEKAVKNNKTGGASFIMGATEKDIETIDSGQNNTTDLNSMAKNKGGTLGIDELAKFYKR
jgi:hypothetical protein